MIGNDVIDLELARKSRWNEIRFWQKILNEDEIDRLQESPNRFLTLWEMWSRKEAVYKIINRQYRIREFNPKSIEIYNANWISFKGEFFYTQSRQEEQSLHTIALCHPKHYGQMKTCDASRLIKKEGIPFYKIGTMEYPASLSHHGKYCKAVYLYGFSGGSGTTSNSPTRVPNS